MYGKPENCSVDLFLNILLNVGLRIKNTRTIFYYKENNVLLQGRNKISKWRRRRTHIGEMNSPNANMLPETEQRCNSNKWCNRCKSVIITIASINSVSTEAYFLFSSRKMFRSNIWIFSVLKKKRHRQKKRSNISLDLGISMAIKPDPIYILTTYWLN